MFFFISNLANAQKFYEAPAMQGPKRPTNAAGVTRYNSSLSELEYGDGTAWWGIDPTQHGSASGTTDGSGDITVSHGFGTASITVTATTTGTTFSVVQVHTKTTTDFKIRFFDASGAAITATSVTADWIAKKQ